MTAEQIAIFTAFKNSTYFVVFIASIQYFGFQPETLLIYGALMTFDLITGALRSAKVESGKSVTSEKMRDGVLKKVLMFVALFTVGLTGKGIGFDTAPLIQASVNVLIVAEGYSILGNIHSFYTGKPKDEFDAITFLLNRLRNLLPKEEKK